MVRTMLSLDPGETTGYAILKASDKQTIKYGEETTDMVIKTGELKLWYGLENLIQESMCDVIVYEQFKLYPWKAKQKHWSTFPTAQVVGVIKFLAEQFEIPILGHGADAKDHFDDKKLKWANLYKGKSPHERDAIRHGLYTIDFDDRLWEV